MRDKEIEELVWIQWPLFFRKSQVAPILFGTAVPHHGVVSNCVADRSYNRLRRLLRPHFVNAPLRSNQAMNGTDEAKYKPSTYVDSHHQLAAQLLAENSRHGTKSNPTSEGFAARACQ